MFESFSFSIPLSFRAPKNVKNILEDQIKKAKEEALETRNLSIQTDSGFYNYKIESINESQGTANSFVRKKLKNKFIKNRGKKLAIQDYSTDREDIAAAEKGDPEAQYRLANVYMDGVLDDKNYDKALRWYSSASDAGHAGAKYRIGLMYANGFGVPKDEDNAIKWFEKAANLEHLEAQIKLAYIYEFEEKHINSKKSFEWQKKIAQKGYPDAQNELAIKYADKRRYKEALEWFIKAAERGNIFARHNLGGYYRIGLGVKKDIEKSIEWLKLAAERGYDESQYQLGTIYYYDKEDMATAKFWFKEAAKKNCPNAQYMLGLIAHQRKEFKKSKKYLNKEKTMTIKARYMLGQYNIFWKVNDSESKNNLLSIFKSAAEEGDFSAQHAMGQIYERGFAVKQNYKKAVEWYEKSAKQDYNKAQYSLGTLYEKGLGVKKDMKQALKLYKRASQQGNIATKFIMYGVLEHSRNEWKATLEMFKNPLVNFKNPDMLYIAGNAVFTKNIRKKRKYIKAVKWYWEKSALEQNQYAQYNLGRFYLLNFEGNRSYVLAYLWLFLSKRNGVKKAGVKLKYLEKIMSKEEIERSNKLIEYHLW